jgi:hypothetical protein
MSEPRQVHRRKLYVGADVRVRLLFTERVLTAKATPEQLAVLCQMFGWKLAKQARPEEPMTEHSCPRCGGDLRLGPDARPTLQEALRWFRSTSGFGDEPEDQVLLERVRVAIGLRPKKGSPSPSEAKHE